MVSKIGGIDLLFLTPESYDQTLSSRGLKPDLTAGVTFFDSKECRWKLALNREITADDLAGTLVHELTHRLGLGEFYAHLRTAKAGRHDAVISKTPIAKTAKALVEGAKVTQGQAKDRGFTLSFTDAFIAVLVRAFHQDPTHIILAPPGKAEALLEENNERVRGALERTQKAIGY